MTTDQLTAYRESAAAAKARADKATPGPWKAENPDDEYCMNVMCVTTGDSHVDDMGPQFLDYGSVVAITLLQSPRYACHESRKWDEDTYFIAAARTDIPTLATAVDELAAEVERLTAERSSLAKALQVVADMQWKCGYIRHQRSEAIEAEKILNDFLKVTHDDR